MTNRITNKRPGKQPWMPLFHSDLRTDEKVLRCGWAARGVWVFMLCAAWKEKPRGVLPGDVAELAGIIGGQIPDVSKAIKELEFHDVFSRGHEFEGHNLPPDAIVNRRMYGDWYESKTKAESGRKGGLATAKKRQKSPAKPRVYHPQHTASKRQAKGRQDPRQNSSKKTTGNAVSTQGLTTEPPKQTPKQTPSAPLYESSDIRSIEQNAEAFRSSSQGDYQGQPVPISDVPIFAAFGDFQSNLLERIRVVTGDGESWMSWFAAALEIMEAFGGHTAAADIVTHAEESADPIIRKAKGLGKLEHAGKFIVDAFYAWGRDTRNTMPPKPAAKGAKT